MSRPPKALTLARVEDLTLGSFALVPTSQTLSHLVRYLSTWSGSDKLFMLLEYVLKLIVPYMHLRARLQHRAGLRTTPVSTAATGMTKLANLAGDARMLFRLWGLLPIVQWLTAIERNPPPTRQLLTIERLQGWAMLAYYPLEHTYYMLAHDVIPATFALPTLASFIPFVASKPTGKLVTLNKGAFGLWSCRFWAAYILLQFVHLKEDHNLLKMREKAVNKCKQAVSYPAEREELRKRWDAFWGEVVVNAAYLPQALHWSLETGLFKDDVRTSAPLSHTGCEGTAVSVYCLLKMVAPRHPH
ncbi:hypothetical protein DAEQUDRAFT_729131 [Daedalea quercina L-15889]|uniref:Uncharacterized protein n=1 Tax=Daedalea quercina L-15889 TaxID=1314783 RepID=A0A165NWR6_9APHY|nr:hypothetical protein DAEQUDRAFT_729131 [Daedalea quercina L-15889]